MLFRSAASSEVDEAPDSAASDAVDDALLSELSELSDEPVCEEEPEEDASVVVPALLLAGAEAPVADDAAVTTPVGVLPLT